MSQPQGSNPNEPQEGQSYGASPTQPSFEAPQSPSAPQQPAYGAPQQPAYGQGAYGAPQQPYQQPGYGAPGYQQAEHPQATTVFVLGIVGIFVTICAFIAWYLGVQARKEIQAGAPYPFDGKLKTGYTLGKVFSIIAIVVFAIYFVLIIFGLVIGFTQN